MAERDKPFPKLDIPNNLRSFAEQGVDKARSAVDNLFGAAHKALSDTERQIDAAHENARDIGRTTVDFAETNIAATFAFASRLARATSLEEWNRLHAEFVTEQAGRFSEQARVLAKSGLGAAGESVTKAAESHASVARKTTAQAPAAAAAAAKASEVPKARVPEAPPAEAKVPEAKVPEAKPATAEPGEPAAQPGKSAASPEPAPSKLAPSEATPAASSPVAAKPVAAKTVAAKPASSKASMSKRDIAKTKTPPTKPATAPVPAGSPGKPASARTPRKPVVRKG